MVASHISLGERKKVCLSFGGKNWNLTEVAQLGRCNEIVSFDVNLIYLGWSVHSLYCTKKSFDKIYPKPKSVFTDSSTSFVQ